MLVLPQELEDETEETDEVLAGQVAVEGLEDETEEEDEVLEEASSAFFDTTEEEDEVLDQVIAAESLLEITEEEDSLAGSGAVYDEELEDESEETDSPHFSFDEILTDESEESDASTGTTPRDVEELVEEESIETDFIARGLRMVPLRPGGFPTPAEPGPSERVLEVRLGPKQTPRDNEINLDELEKKHNQLVKAFKDFIEETEE